MEQILQKLSEIEITAQRIMQDADRTKAALSAEMEQQCKDLDLELEQETNRKIQALRDSLESRKDQELTALRQQTEQHLADLDERSDLTWENSFPTAESPQKSAPCRVS